VLACQQLQFPNLVQQLGYPIHRAAHCINKRIPPLMRQMPASMGTRELRQHPCHVSMLHLSLPACSVTPHGPHR
jgi:hypothetical protein